MIFNVLSHKCEINLGISTFANTISLFYHTAYNLPIDLLFCLGLYCRRAVKKRNATSNFLFINFLTSLHIFLHPHFKQASFIKTNLIYLQPANRQAGNKNKMNIFHATKSIDYKTALPHT